MFCLRFAFCSFIAKLYKATLIPELVLSHTENARAQKRIVMPTGLACNDNGDCFVLDAGASCIHIIGRASVSKVIIIGKSPVSERYAGNISVNTSALTFSKSLPAYISLMVTCT